MSEKIKKYQSYLKGATQAKNLEVKVPLNIGTEIDLFFPKKELPVSGQETTSSKILTKQEKIKKDKTQLEIDLERIRTDPEGYVEDLVDLYNCEDNDTKESKTESKPEIKTETIRNKNTLNYLNKTKPSKINGAINLKPKKDYRFRSFDGVNTWSLIRDTATTAEEKNNVKQILNKNYSNSRQRASMDEEDLKFINKHPSQLKEIEEKKKAAAEESARFERDLAAMREFRTESEVVDRSFEKFLEELNRKEKEPAQGLAYLLGMDK